MVRDTNDRYNQEMLARVQVGIRERLHDTPVLRKLSKLTFGTNLIDLGRRLRRETLNFKISADIQRWQVLHNDHERYEIVSSRESDDKGEHCCHIVYFEHGDALPLVKSQTDLRADDEDRIEELS
jgi:hypothetical protein